MRPGNLPAGPSPRFSPCLAPRSRLSISSEKIRRARRRLAPATKMPKPRRKGIAVAARPVLPKYQLEVGRTFLLRVYGNVSSHRIMALAAGMTYYSLLAIFPVIAALVAVYGLFSDPSTIARHLDQLGGFMPGGAVDVAREQLTRVSSKGSQALGLTFLIGLGVSLWSANAAMKSLFDTLNIVHGEEERRGFVKLNAISLGFTICSVFFMLAALGSIVAVPVILNYVGLSNAVDLLLEGGPRCS